MIWVTSTTTIFLGLVVKEVLDGISGPAGSAMTPHPHPAERARRQKRDGDGGLMRWDRTKYFPWSS